jgi:acyl-CoA synthetase (NDP forming)
VTRDLRPLFDPRSVAIVGASDDPAKWGHWLGRGALKGEDRRSVFLVNRNGGEVLGRQAFASLAELPEPPELVVVSVPATAFEQAVDDALAVGARALVGITAGLGEQGGEKAERERALAARVREAGAVLVGPNCLGVYDAGAGLDLSSNEFSPGSIGLVSQSGNLALEIGRLGETVGLGFSRFVSLGNQADLEAADLVRSFAAHDETRLIAVYCEDFRDGRAFAQACKDAIESGTPVLLLTVGASEPSARAARSHTGALVSDLAAVDAACRAAGVIRVRTPKELVDLAQALLAPRLPKGPRTAIVADGGGHGVVTTDLAVAAGLELPLLSDALSGELASILPPTAATRNPVDFAGGGEQDISNFERVCRALLRSGEVDTVLLTGYFGGYSAYADEFLAQEIEVAEGMVAAVGELDRALFVHTMYWDSPPAGALRAGDVPVYREVEAATSALARLASRLDGRAPGVPGIPEPASAIGADDYWTARELLADAGLSFAPARRATDAGEAVAAAEEVGYPVALKALGRLHKSDAGGVALGIGDRDALETAVADMVARLDPPAFSVERMAPLADGVELIVGARRDLRFGPIALVGIGGLYAEVLEDVAVALAPASPDDGAELVRSLRGAPLLTGARNRAPLDVEAAGRALAAVSRVAAEHPEIAEIEVNPLLVLPEGVLGLDARVVLRGESADAR